MSLVDDASSRYESVLGGSQEKMVDAVLGRGMSREEAAHALGVGVPSVKRYAKMADKGE